MGPRRKSEMSKLDKIAISESLDVNISSGLCVGEFQNVFKTSSPYLLHRSYVVSYMFSQVRITLDTHNTGTQSDLKNFQELTEIWISSHSENVHLPTLPRDLSSNLAPHALSRRLRSANIRDKKKNPSESIRSTLSRMFRGSKSDSESKMTTAQILFTHCQDVDQYVALFSYTDTNTLLTETQIRHLKLLVKAILKVCRENKKVKFPPRHLKDFLGMSSTKKEGVRRNAV